MCLGGKHVFDALRHHWPEYLMEAAGLGLFMMSAGLFTTLMEYPGSPLHQWIGSTLLRRGLIGLAMGGTAIALIYSPWGQQSGAHYNPAVTLTFFRLGKVRPWDAFFYITAQFVGGFAGVLIISAVLRESFRQAPVAYVATIPGPLGPPVAFLAETVISFTMMAMVLTATNTKIVARYTGVFAGVLICAFIILEAPLSGMSMNPARSVSSAAPARAWRDIWVYFSAPVLGMFLAAEAYRWARGSHGVLCAKLNHQTTRRCIFHCSRTVLPGAVMAALALCHHMRLGLFV
jgi:aquaporin Z